MIYSACGAIFLKFSKVRILYCATGHSCMYRSQNKWGPARQIPTSHYHKLAFYGNHKKLIFVGASLLAKMILEQARSYKKRKLC